MIETLEHDIAGGIAEVLGLSDRKRQRIYEYIKNQLLRAVDLEECAEAIYLTNPQSDGLARYSNGKQVTPDLPYCRLEEFEKDKLRIQAAAVLDTAGFRYEKR